MSTPFDYLNSIMTNKDNMMRGTENDVLAEQQYVPWLANLGMSYHPDTLMIANILNMNFHLQNRPQYEIALNIVRAKKRPFVKWSKKVLDDNLDFVCQVYQCNRTIGQQYLGLLSDEQLQALRKQREEGGKYNERTR